MTRVLLDINVVLDVLADREPFADESAAVLRYVESRELTGLVAAHTLPTLHYLLSKHVSKAKAQTILTDLLHLVEIVPVDEDRLRHALALNWPDFEDALQAACGESGNAAYIVTRDKRGFKRATIRVTTPAELLALLQ